MKLPKLLLSALLMASCHTHQVIPDSKKDPDSAQVARFGTIHPVLQKYAPGETITRVDQISYEQKDSINYINVSFYTNKGLHKVTIDQFKEGGNRNAFNSVGIRNKNGPVTVHMVNGIIACPDTTCTLVITTN